MRDRWELGLVWLDLAHLGSVWLTLARFGSGVRLRRRGPLLFWRLRRCCANPMAFDQ